MLINSAFAQGISSIPQESFSGALLPLTALLISLFFWVFIALWFLRGYPRMKRTTQEDKAAADAAVLRAYGAKEVALPEDRKTKSDAPEKPKGLGIWVVS